ncbi:very short patch repair endonuclease [Kribbella antibiotica]|uniref:Very short patch repair endonuclease n=1 Tax=Kribbella antibiotica TaxID=190195 RepID=A0A4R4ZM78_9ACTN|nr:very short patch repair endonuclease [Kribbella antibiotica]TDD59340.1 very short patch repair endonuclease [Kribbella antibiotica]
MNPRRTQAQTSAARPIPSYGETPTTPGRSRNMRAIRRANTKPEVELRSALHRQGYRFRKDLSIYTTTRRVRPDVVFTARKVAVFVDGCFWHCCPEHGRKPSVNSGYWSPKLQRNVERDRLADTALQQDGWTVVRVWEHEEIGTALATVIRALGESGRD